VDIQRYIHPPAPPSDVVGIEVVSLSVLQLLMFVFNVAIPCRVTVYKDQKFSATHEILRKVLKTLR